MDNSPKTKSEANGTLHSQLDHGTKPYWFLVCFGLMLPIGLLVAHDDKLTPPTSMSQTLSSEQKGCSLIVSIEITANKIEYNYTFQNNTPATVFVFNLPVSKFLDAGKALVAKEAATVEVLQSRAVIGHKVIPVPPGVFVEIERTPCATRLFSMNSLKGHGVVDVPLKTQTPYSSFGRKKQDDPTPKPLQVYFEVGYIVDIPGTEQMGDLLTTNEGPAWNFSGFSSGSQTIVSVGPFADQVLGIVPQ